MNITWQEVATAAVLLLAVGYVACRVFRFFRRKGMPDCRCCPKCPADEHKNPLVAIEDRIGRSEQNGH